MDRFLMGTAETPVGDSPALAWFYCENALLTSGWARDVLLAVDGSGWIREVRHGHRDAHRCLGRYVVPGMPNAHSHAFQFAMAGLSERVGPAGDDFWTWRETMYQFAGRMDPELMQAIAAMAYAEMLRHGFTTVCEFHYLHHGPDGQRLSPPAAMAQALLAAAESVGIGITLLPTLYQTAGFDGAPLSARQRRFGHDLEGFLQLVAQLRDLDNEQAITGIAIHSLRAVPPEALTALLADPMAVAGPIHIHIAEQLREVTDCLGARRARPVEWLLANADVDPRWCLVHATHVADAEVRAMADAGAVVALCPTTEANLGDGVFPLRAFLDAGGAIAVGSDSHVSISPVEDLRWLEYGQRLATLSRNVVAGADRPSTGETLWHEALVGGAQASGRKVGALAPDHRADWLVLDETVPSLQAREPGEIIDALVFAGNRNPVRETWIAGRRRVADGRHVDEARLIKAFGRAMRVLRA
jgi:formimidoylglutamate deiminase